MILRKGNVRGTSRLMVGLFVVQLVLTGFCLLTADAHAMPIPQMSKQQTDDMGGMCSKSVSHDEEHHSDGCFHCDEPDQFVKAGSADITPVNLVLVALSVLPGMPALTTWDEATVFHTPTGPPRSSSLLFTTTQRIRV